MKILKFLLSIIIVAVLSVIGYLGYQTYLAPPPPTPTPQPVTNDPNNSPTVISAEGRVTPKQYVGLSFPMSGLLEQVMVSSGDIVQAGQVLARLEGHTRLEANITAAEFERLSAQQALDALSDHLDLIAAQAQKDLADSENALHNAEDHLNTIISPARQADIDQARANEILLANALELARQDYAPYANKPEDNLTRASLQSKLSQVQAQYDQAVSLLNNLLAPANQLDLTQAEASLALAKVSLVEAQINFDILSKGPDPDQVALAQARLQNAEKQLAVANDSLNDLELRAPFIGTIISSDLKQGQFISPGIPLVTLADLTTWQVKTIDLTESDAARLSIAMKESAKLTISITLDAFPGQTFSGELVEIGQIGEDTRGDITYPVTISFNPGEVPVRWGMTAFVDIRL